MHSRQANCRANQAEDDESHKIVVRTKFDPPNEQALQGILHRRNKVTV